MNAVGTEGLRVLVVDDEPQIRRLLSVSLGSRGYEVETVAGGEQGLEELRARDFDLLLLDLGLPDVDGLEVCQRVRLFSPIPIIVVSVREDERDKIAALDLGADDYVTKPFSIDELLARIRANLRRSASPTDSPVFTFGALTVDLARRRVTRQACAAGAGTDVPPADEIHLTPTEYDLLRVLASHAGKVITHRQLLREVRGPAYEEETPLLRVHMVALRQKLGIAPGTSGYIATEPAVGYRLLE